MLMNSRRRYTWFVPTLLISLGLSHGAEAARLTKAEIDAQAQEAESTIKTDLLTPEILQIVETENTKPLGKVKERIEENKTWRAQKESTTHPMIDTVLDNTLSKQLTQLRNTHAQKYPFIVIVGEGATVLGATQAPADYYYGHKSAWRQIKRERTMVVSGDHYDHQTHQHSTVIDLPIEQQGKLMGMLEVGWNLKSAESEKPKKETH